MKEKQLEREREKKSKFIKWQCENKNKYGNKEGKLSEIMNEEELLSHKKM